MARRLYLAMSPARLWAAAWMAVIVSLHLAIYAESSHTHADDDPDLAGRCLVCQLVHDPGPTFGPGAQYTPGPSSQRTPALHRPWSTPRTTDFRRNRSRAPPVLVSI